MISKIIISLVLFSFGSINASDWSVHLDGKNQSWSFKEKEFDFSRVEIILSMLEFENDNKSNLYLKINLEIELKFLEEVCKKNIKRADEAYNEVKTRWPSLGFTRKLVTYEFVDKYIQNIRETYLMN